MSPVYILIVSKNIVKTFELNWSTFQMKITHALVTTLTFGCCCCLFADEINIGVLYSTITTHTQIRSNLTLNSILNIGKVLIKFVSHLLNENRFLLLLPTRQYTQKTLVYGCTIIINTYTGYHACICVKE